MNILASYTWMKESLKRPKSVAEFSRLMTDAGNSVEHIIDVGSTLDGMVVGQIVEVKPHPNADKLRVAETDVGGRRVEIVCGGLNLEVGQKVAVALPGSKVRWHGEGDLVELKETSIRGVKSVGMICAPDEVGFEKLQQGERMIWDLTALTDAKPGTPLAKALDLDDTLFDIEVTTNRPDAMSIVGLAREAGAVGAGVFSWKEPKMAAVKGAKGGVEVKVEAKDLCPRYQAVVIEGVKVGPSPWWLQKRLLLAGHRPINNVVDITNYILHELGQPLHAFDADKIQGGSIVVRTAKKGETLLALDGRTYELDPSMLVIADTERPVAIAGVMGGEETGTKESTTRLILESATFDAVSVRRTARALNLYSDASGLFEKGLSTETTTHALARAVELIAELCGGAVSGGVVDRQAKTYKPLTLAFDPEAISARIGVEIPAAKQMQILENLGFTFGKNRRQVTVPYWRDHDIEASVDFAEEIARVYGYAVLPTELPPGIIPTPVRDEKLVWERRLKELLKGAGVSEAYNMPFLSEEDLNRLDMPAHTAVKIQNPLTDELAYLRPSLLPSMLRVVEANQHRFEKAQLFELAEAHAPVDGDIPKRWMQLIVAVYEKDGEAAFRRAKGILERMLRETGVTSFAIEPLNTPEPLWHPGRSARVSVGSQDVGRLGELAPLYAKRFGIDVRLVVANITIDALLPRFGSGKAYAAIPEFPEVIRDISFSAPRQKTHKEITAALQDIDPLIVATELVDLYEETSRTYRLVLRASDRTLSREDADQVMKRVEKMILDRFDGTIR